MPTDTLSRTFAALADPTRRAMLARLAEGEATVNELAAPFDMSLPNISKHLKVLQGAGLVVQGRQGQFRPCRLDPAAFEDATDWLQQHPPQYQEGMGPPPSPPRPGCVRGRDRLARTAPSAVRGADGPPR